MSKRSKADAAMLLLSMKAGLLGADVIPVMKFMAGFSVTVSAAEETLHKLERLDLVRRDINLMDGKQVLLLTNWGKKVVSVMKENPKDFQEAA